MKSKGAVLRGGSFRGFGREGRRRQPDFSKTPAPAGCARAGEGTARAVDAGHAAGGREGGQLLDVDGEKERLAGAPQCSVSACGSASGEGAGAPILSDDGADNVAGEDGLRERAEAACAVTDAVEKPDPYVIFCAEYDLSPRESEVFRLWVTGHGLKYIQNALFVSESMVKSHLRSIYRKCDTHNRDKIIALFERETGDQG